jgi:hypothetical protein
MGKNGNQTNVLEFRAKLWYDFINSWDDGPIAVRDEMDYN